MVQVVEPLKESKMPDVSAETIVRNEMAHMNSTGDTKVMWDPKNPDEVAAAKVQFDTLRAKGFIAYTVNKKGGTGDILRQFDPDAEKIILSPPIVGG